MSIKKNYIYNTCYQVFSVLLPLITVPYISRTLGVEGVGYYAYTAAYTQYFILVGMLGITLYGRREVAYVNNDKKKLSYIFCNIYTVQITTMTLAYITYILAFVIFNNKSRELYLVQSLLILGSMFDISWFFIGIEELKHVVLRNLFVKLIGLLLVFSFVKNTNDILLYAIIMGCSVLVGQLIMWINLKNKVYFVKPNREHIKIHIQQSIKLFISQLALQMYMVVDRTMLGIFSDNIQVGLYDSSQKVIKVVLALVTSIAVIMLPRMSALYYNNQREDFKNLLHKVFSYINFLGIPIMIGLIAISEEFSIWFYGKQFNGISQLLIVGSIIIIAISWSNVLGVQVMIPIKKEREFTISITIGAIINFILNIILIGRLGAMGSTIATVLAEVTVTIIQLCFLRELINFKYVLSTFYKPIICVIPMYIGVRLAITTLPINIVGTSIAVIIGGVIYLGLSYLLKHELMIEGVDDIKEKLIRRRKENEKI